VEDVQQLRVFRAVAEKLSFTRAAEVLFITQSAVSHAVAALERNLGVMLFERRGRRVNLTSAGRVLLEQVPRVFAALAEAETRTKQSGRPELGRLRVGVSPTACQYLLPESIREFRESYPKYSLAVEVADSPRVVELLRENRIDLGVMLRAERSGTLVYHELFRDQLGFLVSPLHPWARAGEAERESIAAQHYILYSRGSTTFRLVEKHMATLGAPLQDYLELGSMEAIKELVKLGVGVSVVAPWIAKVELQERSLVWLPMPGRKLQRTWCVAHEAGRRPNIAEQTFIGLSRAVGMELAS
jgi:LysR family transcriptional regulator, low CO2-responsive transcriptional regulator